MQAIEVSGLGKTYRRGETFAATLSKQLSQTLLGLGRSGRRMAGSATASRSDDEFWALQGVDFNVSEGEIVGIIGRNGAGKSTLLKILSRITAPTSGHAMIRGRIASLLEVGTGFHPELTGRENIFLNGAIMGLKTEETRRKFDEIVDFAEIADFIDTPVKRYSSGMYLRLAFSVAANLEAETLLVDEILAVGDASFQKRCLGKMNEVSRQGRTILFVSHNMVSLKGLCTRGIYLDAGRLVMDATADEAIRCYMDSLDRTVSQSLENREDRRGNGRLRFTGFWAEGPDRSRTDRVTLGDTVTLCLSYESDCQLEDVYVAFDLWEQAGDPLVNFNTADVGLDFDRIPKKGVFRCEISRLPLRGARYLGNVYCASKGDVCDWIQYAIQLTVEDGDFFGTGKLRNRSKFVMPHVWTVEEC